MSIAILAISELHQDNLTLWALPLKYGNGGQQAASVCENMTIFGMITRIASQFSEDYVE